MKGIASACGSATVVNAIATGKGAAFGIDLRVRAEVELTDEAGKITGRVIGAPRESPSLIETCARKALGFFGLDRTHGAEVKTTSEVPIAVGLSSSSAAANAVVLATFAALGKKARAKNVLNLAVDAAFDAGVTVTGAFDDASASYFGQGVVTDNLKRRVLKRFSLEPGLDVLIQVPPSKMPTAKFDKGAVKPIAKFVDVAHEQALLGNTFGALTLNGLLYSIALNRDPSIAFDALAAGALAAGLTGTGPATVAIARSKNTNAIKRAWRKRPGGVIVTKPATEGARIEVEK